MKKYQLSSKVQWSEVLGEISILDISTGTVYTLNHTGKVMWKAILESSSEEEILESISEELQVFEKDMIKQPLDNFRQELILKGLLVENK